MRYFFLIYAIFAVLLVGILGFRGQHFTKPPLRIFPDMKEQDKLKGQRPDAFFADGMGARQPVAETQPRGLNEEGAREIGGVPEYEFGGQPAYYYSGHIGDYFGTGMPEELSLKADNVQAFLKHGQERYHIYCAVCHGASGNGQGMTSKYGVPGIADLRGPAVKALPDGRIFRVISDGKGMMGPYKHNIPVRDRWAIVAYIHALQAANAGKTPAK